MHHTKSSQNSRYTHAEHISKTCTGQLGISQSRKTIVSISVLVGGLGTGISYSQKPAPTSESSYCDAPPHTLLLLSSLMALNPGELS